MLMLSGCGSPELLAPALAEMPGISKSSQATRTSQEARRQETLQSEASRQLLAAPGDAMPLLSDCSYYCREFGFHRGGKCSQQQILTWDRQWEYTDQCRCLVEHREVKALWNGWVSEGICSPTTLSNQKEYCGPNADPYKCDFPSQKQSEDRDFGMCGPPGFHGNTWGYLMDNDLDLYGNYDGKYFKQEDVCKLWGMSLSVGSYHTLISRVKIGVNETPACLRWADIPYACTK
eukprot:Skav234966  [mRNA]  locus=scaffold943:485664:486362:+ [translate_table: standard]